MAIIAPFRGLTYNYQAGPDISNVVAPPYDVISQDEQDAYHSADPRNVIRLILGKKKAGDSDWDNRYTRAAEHFRRWESEGTLVRADQPSVYITSLTYDPGTGDGPRTRWGLITLARIEDPESGVILPHEKTFSAHKDDRLKLMRACNAQFSQIFGLYEDTEDNAIRACRKYTDVPPEIDFDFKDGTRHRMWILQRPLLFKELADIMASRRIFIADGHHRYETARNFREIMRARHGWRSPDRPYEYVMMYMSNMCDEGLTILPSHRLIKSVPGFQIDLFLERAGQWFDIEEFPVSGDDISKQCIELKHRLEQKGDFTTAIAFYWNKADRPFILTLKPGQGDRIGNDLHPSLKKLDVLVLSKLILQKGLGFISEDLDNNDLFHYESIMEKAVSQVKSGDYEMTFLMNPTKIGHVEEIASNSLVMPRKSTYFYPKVMTGLVFNRIEPHETIQVP